MHARAFTHSAHTDLGLGGLSGIVGAKRPLGSLCRCVRVRVQGRAWVGNSAGERECDVGEEGRGRGRAHRAHSKAPQGRHPSRGQFGRADPYAPKPTSHPHPTPTRHARAPTAPTTPFAHAPGKRPPRHPLTHSPCSSSPTHPRLTSPRLSPSSSTSEVTATLFRDMPRSALPARARARFCKRACAGVWRGGCCCAARSQGHGLAQNIGCSRV